MYPIAQYKLVDGKDANTLTKVVQQLLVDGWEPLGRAFAVRTPAVDDSPTFYQTMTKEKGGEVGIVPDSH